MTVVEIIRQLHRDENFRIVVATPSNSAAYSLTDQLIQSGMDRKDLIRIISNNQLENNLVPDYLYDFCVTVNADNGNSKKDEDASLIKMFLDTITYKSWFFRLT